VQREALVSLLYHALMPDDPREAMQQHEVWQETYRLRMQRDPRALQIGVYAAA
jgi:hypothetical protein